MDGIETSIERGGGTEAERRQDGGGTRAPLPGSEDLRGNEAPQVNAPEGSKESWTPEEGTRKSDPAND